MRLSLLAAALATLMVGSCANGATEVAELPQDQEIIRAPASIAFTGVTVIPMTSETRLRNQTVIVRDGRVESIEPDGRRPLPNDVTVVEGRGRFLMPALVDMHVHLRRADLPAYLRAGIATVRNMWGHDAIATMQRDIASGALDGPTIYSASNGMDANPPRWPFTRLVLDPADAATAVDEAVARGWKWIKVYQQLSAEVYDSIMTAARRRGILAVGHVPTAVPVLRAVAAGQRSIEHLGGYDLAVARRVAGTGTYSWVDVDQSRFADLVRATVQAGTWNCPTMAIYLQFAQQHPPDERARLIENRRRFIAEMARQGARLLVGTDAGIEVVAPGTSIRDELREFVAAGLTPYQALRAATVDAGEFLAVPALGTVTVGAPADLLLIDADPLSNVSNVERISGLLMRGSWYSARALSTSASRRP